ncbi:Cysteine desulfurase IscS [Chlamydiales bacterium STE3]|nr:Cysteine desulfurase IscS [Chlamydiales bacterium STE3]
MNHPIYLDNSTTTRPSGEAVSKMLTYYSDKWGAPSSPHKMGQELFPAIEESLRSLYKLLGAEDKNYIVITSSGAEAVNHAILSTYQDVTLATGKNHFVTSNIDEAPALLSLNRLDQFGCSTSVVKANFQGMVTAQAISEAISPRTALVALSYANGLTGVINPLIEIAALCKLRGIRLLIDMTHVLGKLVVDLKEIDPDFIAFNGDHLHAPKGTGGLYMREDVKCSSFILGGIEQAGLRAGTLNVPAFIGLGEAAKEAFSARDYICTEIARLKFYFESEVLRRIPEAIIFFENEERLPHITAIAFPGVSSEAFLFLLNRKGLYASMGGGSQQQIGYLLNACGIEHSLANCGLSFSFSRETTEEEVERALIILEQSYAKLRKLSEKIVPKRS